MLQGQAIAIERGPLARPLSAPNIYLVRMGIFLVLVGFVAFILYRQLIAAFFGNPGLNGLILGVLLVGIVLAVRQVARLYREVRWVNAVGRDDRTRLAKAPVFLAPMATVLGTDGGRQTLTLATTRTLLDSIAVRLEENRELVRYLAGLLVFLGLLGTFWGLIETVSSVGRVIGSLRGGADAGALDELKTSLSPMLAGMGVSFSASLFGLAGSLVLGFLDLQAGQASSRFYTELEDWLVVSTNLDAPGALADTPAATGPAELTAAIARLTQTVEASGQRGTADAVANLADSIQGLVTHMRSEQQMIHRLVEGQAERERELKLVLDRLAKAS